MIGRYIIFEAVGKAVVQEYEVPTPQGHEVLLESDYSLVSAGTERANLVRLPNTGTWECGFPFYPGYSAAGRVLAVGPDVKNFQVGDRAIIPWGGHRSHTIKLDSQAMKIEDDSIDLFDAAMAHVASFAFLGVRKLKLELGEAAVIVGQGLLGAFAVQIANLSGAFPVLALDFDPVRRKLALQLGAAAAFSPDDEHLVDRIQAATDGRGPNGVVEVTGSAQALQQALEYIAWEGRISLLGCTRISDAPIDYYKYVHRRGITLIGSHTNTRPGQESRPGQWTEHDDYRTFLKLVKAGKLQTRPLVSEVVSPDTAPAVYARLAEVKNPPLGIMFDWRKTR